MPRSRREFLIQASSILASVAATLALSPARARGLTLNVTTARRLDEELVYPIPAQDGVTIDREHEVILTRHQNVLMAFSLFCPHQKTRLKWQDDQGRFQCPKHKSIYEPDGEFISGRATRGMDRHAIRRANETVVVDPAVVYQQDKDPAAWNAAVVRL